MIDCSKIISQLIENQSSGGVSGLSSGEVSSPVAASKIKVNCLTIKIL